MQKKLTFKSRDRLYELTLELESNGYRLSIKELQLSASNHSGSETVVQAEVLRPPDGVIITPQGRFHCAVARDSGGVWVSCRGHVRYFEIERGRGEVKTSVDHELRAPMTGRLVSLRAQTGQLMQEGETVAVLEAMKMEFRIEAPYTAHVEVILCREGDLVDLGQVLVKLAKQPAQSGLPRTLRSERSSEERIP